MKMKTTLKLAVMVALMAMGVTQTNAATTAKTIWVAHVNFTLTAWEDGVGKPVKITNKDIINDLSGVNIGGATNPVFSTGSQLLLKEDTTTSNQVLVVRDPKTKVDTDVGALFTTDSSATVSFTPPNGKTTLNHSITTFSLSGVPAVSFTLTGFRTQTRTVVNGDEVTKAATADLAGPGTISTTDVVIHGTVSNSGGRLEAP